MSTRRLLALLALLLGIVAGLLLVLELIDISGSMNVNLLVDKILSFVFGLVLIVAALVIWNRQYIEGGIVSVIIGILVLILGLPAIPGLLGLFAGILGIVAEEAR